ncbi:hypothetical protein [Microbispora sp. NBRC 16548]|uniref:hypothetical protein n=1 Tax=Microbispora sp. NBRC 16548 TaxID=3030994 RepID=UPI0024A386DF|nr:hypothetical protein [Microbispora sp. NBRC 16548]GLX06589.1 hypothetical protein Misp03_35160 [Microbispora sp. NBRC 16548]
MGSVHRLQQPSSAPLLGAAAGAFLAQVANVNTARAYSIALRVLALEFGERAPLAELEGALCQRGEVQGSACLRRRRAAVATSSNTLQHSPLPATVSIGEAAKLHSNSTALLCG